jgi:type III restriction enzyme
VVVTNVTRKRLDHWNDETARESQFRFCQLKAIETLIWWVEGAAEYKRGIAIPGGGGLWERLCNKMATGAGKTADMAMIMRIASQLPGSGPTEFRASPAA